MAANIIKNLIVQTSVRGREPCGARDSPVVDACAIVSVIKQINWTVVRSEHHTTILGLVSRKSTDPACDNAVVIVSLRGLNEAGVMHGPGSTVLPGFANATKPQQSSMPVHVVGGRWLVDGPCWRHGLRFKVKAGKPSQAGGPA
jgi:hypothetical protein